MSVPRRWRWWVTDGSPVDERRVESGEPLALVGGRHDALAAWATAVDASRPVIDLREGRRVPTVREVHALAAGPAPIVIASTATRVLYALGLSVQPYFVAAVPLSARPGEAVALLQAAIDDHATDRPLHLAQLGRRVDAVRAYTWPGGLAEVRAASRVIAALIEAGSVSAAARRLTVTRQALGRWLAKRF